MIRDVCDQCGERNVAGAMFCASCNAYLAWEPTTVQPRVVPPQAPDLSGQAAWSTGPAPAMAGSSGPDQRTVPPQPNTPTVVPPPPPSRATKRLEAELRPAEIIVAPGASPVSVEVRIANQSDIVDAYVVDAPGAPSWLQVSRGEVRLMPGTEEVTSIQFGIAEGVLAPAQTVPLFVRVQSGADTELICVLRLMVTVPQVDAEIALEVEPSIIRVTDETAGHFRVVADNSRGNGPVRLRLDADDPEQVIHVSFSSPVLEVPAGQSATSLARVQAPLPAPGEETSRQLTVSATNGARTTKATVTFTQRASVQVADPPIALSLQPSLLKVTDSSIGQLRVDADNSAGRRPARITLAGRDAEGAVQIRFSPAVLDLAPGSTGSAMVHLQAPLPEPGAEAARPITLIARYEGRTVEATGTFLQRSSPPAINVVTLRLEPPLVRVQDSSSGQLRVVADNRAGRQPVRMWLSGRDAEGTAQFEFSTPYLDVAAGQQAAAVVHLRADRPEGGTAASRAFTIMASDGQREVSADGTFAQTSSDRRPLARTLFTVLGGLAMILGSLLSWTAAFELTGVDTTPNNLGSLFGFSTPDLGSAGELLSLGALMILLGVLAIWGRLGPKGRLTRLVALLGALVAVAFLVAGIVTNSTGGPGFGLILVLAGCVSAYIGGQLAKR